MCCRGERRREGAGLKRAEAFAFARSQNAKSETREGADRRPAADTISWCRRWLSPPQRCAPSPARSIVRGIAFHFRERRARTMGKREADEDESAFPRGGWGGGNERADRDNDDASKRRKKTNGMFENADDAVRTKHTAMRKMRRRGFRVRADDETHRALTARASMSPSTRARRVAEPPPPPLFFRLERSRASHARLTRAL